MQIYVQLIDSIRSRALMPLSEKDEKWLDWVKLWKQFSLCIIDSRDKSVEARNVTKSSQNPSGDVTARFIKNTLNSTPTKNGGNLLISSLNVSKIFILFPFHPPHASRFNCLSRSSLIHQDGKIAWKTIFYVVVFLHRVHHSISTKQTLEDNLPLINKKTWMLLSLADAFIIYANTLQLKNKLRWVF